MEYILPILIPIVLIFLFQNIFPYKPSGKYSPSDIERNKSKYDKLEALALVFIPISVALVGFLIYYIGVQVAEYVFSSYEYIMKPPTAFWGALGFVLGIGLIRIPMEFIYKLILGREGYTLYTEYTNRKHGWDGSKFWRPIESILSFVGISLFILGLNWYVRINGGAVEFNDLFSLKAQTKKLSEISEIKHCSDSSTVNGHTKNKEYYVVKTNDGYEWDSKIYSFFTDVEDDYTELKNKMKQLSESLNLTIKEE